MHDIFALLDSEGQLYQFKLKGMGVSPILDPEKLSEANLRMQQSYAIPSLQYRRAWPPSSTPKNSPKRTCACSRATPSPPCNTAKAPPTATSCRRGPCQSTCAVAAT